jgi:hypothetical protein
MVVLFGNRLECINVMSRTNKFQLMEYVQENEKLVFLPNHVKSKYVFKKLKVLFMCAIKFNRQRLGIKFSFNFLYICANHLLSYKCTKIIRSMKISHITAKITDLQKHIIKTQFVYRKRKYFQWVHHSINESGSEGLGVFLFLGNGNWNIAYSCK